MWGAASASQQENWLMKTQIEEMYRRVDRSVYPQTSDVRLGDFDIEIDVHAILRRLARSCCCSLESP